ncbi:MAG: lipoyl synthase [Porphyromonas sp.]|nr:lipoyl synthase [Porphyromonas sp.]
MDQTTPQKHVKEPRKPDWLKIKLSSVDSYSAISHTIHNAGLHTICSSGMCPNMSECWSRGTATFMIGGNVCTRACRFCATQSAKTPPPLNHNEPMEVARSIQDMRLKYAVITSVDRDDLPDGGAQHWVDVILAVRELNPETTIEVLIPDFGGDQKALDLVLQTKPDVVGHNLETVRRLTPSVRHTATYETSLKVLRQISESGCVTKTGIMVGLGETPEEVESLFRDCVEVGVDTLTVGQYLRPNKKLLPVVEYVHPDQFARYKEIGEALGLKHVESGPLVRSSYRADTQFATAKKALDLKDLTIRNNNNATR